MDLSLEKPADAYSCTECGRCSAACPANATGKLSVLEDQGWIPATGWKKRAATSRPTEHLKMTAKTLLNNYISVEEPVPVPPAMPATFRKRPVSTSKPIIDHP